MYHIHFRFQGQKPKTKPIGQRWYIGDQSAEIQNERIN